MLNDVLLIKEKHENAAKDIFQRIKNKDLTKFIIAISGESGSGKTEVAHCIAQLFKKEGIRAKTLHTDNYYNTHPIERPAIRKKNNYESVGIKEYLWTDINENVLDFKKDKISELPCVDIISEQVDTLITDFSEVQILIVDGLYAIKTKYVDLKIFIELTYHQTKLAQLKRGKESLDESRMKVLLREHEDVKSLKPLADLLISEDYKVYEA